MTLAAASTNYISHSPTPGGVSPLASPVSPKMQEEIQDDLARYVRGAFIEADMYRRVSGVEERLLRALRARRYVYDPEDAGLVGSIDVYIGLTALKCRAAESWINDILLSAIDKPWTLKPTPIPELPPWMKEQVVDALQAELQAQGIPMDLRARAKQLKDAALKYAIQKAETACAGMEAKIEDQLMEGGWREAFAEFIRIFVPSPLHLCERRLLKISAG